MTETPARNPLLNPLAFEGICGAINTTVTPMALNRHGKLLQERFEPHRTALAMAIPLQEFYSEVVPALQLVQRMRKLGSICKHTVELHGNKSMLRRRCCGSLYDTEEPMDLLGCVCPGCSRVIVVDDMAMQYIDDKEVIDDA